MGFEIAGPVVICDTPGTLANASIKLVATPLNNSSFFIMVTGVGVLLVEVALKKLVTITFPPSRTELISVKLMSVFFWSVIFSTSVAYPT